MNEISTTNAVELQDVWFSYRPGAWVVQGVSCAVASGSIVMVMGPSGTGKTTLLKIIGGFLRPKRGRVRVLGQELNGHMPAALRLRVGYIPQQLGLVRTLTVLDNVLMGTLGRHRGPRVLFWGRFSSQDLDEAHRRLEQMGLSHKAHERVYRLSGGERQRVAIARTLMQRPHLILADEFVSDLDLPRAAEMVGLMRRIGQTEGLTFMMNMHEVQLVQELGDEVWLMKGGRLLQQSPASTVNFEWLEAALR